jgi:hypothetical protein
VNLRCAATGRPLKSLAIDPLALRVARRHLAAVRDLDPAALDPAESIERNASEYQRRRDEPVPVNDDEEEGQADEPLGVLERGSR